MNTINTFRQSVNLFRASFVGISPFLLIGMCSTAILMFVSNNESASSSFEWLFITLMYVLSYVMQICILVGIYYQYHRQRLVFTEIFRQAISKTPTLFVLTMLFLLPLLFVLSMHFIPAMLSGNIELANFSFEDYLSSIENLGTVSTLVICVTLFMSAYLFLVYGYLADLGVAVKNLTLRESLLRSKALVENYKWFIFKALIILHLFARAIDFIIVPLLGEMTAAMFSWLIYSPLNACFIVLVYEALEKLKRPQKSSIKSDDLIESS